MIKLYVVEVLNKRQCWKSNRLRFGKLFVIVRRHMLGQLGIKQFMELYSQDVISINQILNQSLAMLTGIYTFPKEATKSILIADITVSASWPQSHPSPHRRSPTWRWPSSSSRLLPRTWSTTIIVKSSKVFLLLPPNCKRYCSLQHRTLFKLNTAWKLWKLL